MAAVTSLERDYGGPPGPKMAAEAKMAASRRTRKTPPQASGSILGLPDYKMGHFSDVTAAILSKHGGR